MSECPGRLHGITAYIPTHNNEDTIRESILSVLRQTVTPDEVYVIDDGSTDLTGNVARSTGIKVLSNERNMGRGFTRARAVDHAKYNMILCCDATNSLEMSFIEKTLPFFEDPKVVSVSGRLVSKEFPGAVARWRSRHLFREDEDFGPPVPTPMLITYGTLMKTEAILEVGNFDRTLVHTEDNELGLRLHAAGYKILGMPDAIIQSIAVPRLLKTLERYWRWFAGVDEKVTLRSYLHSIKASLRPMAQKDLANGDWASALISLFCPHYCLWKTLSRKLAGQANRN